MDKATFEHRQEGNKGGDHAKTVGRKKKDWVQQEGRAGAKSLRREGAWHVLGVAEEPSIAKAMVEERGVLRR